MPAFMSRTLSKPSDPTREGAGASQRAAWGQVLTLSLTETISWGILYYAFSVFLVPMGQALGWSRTELTGAFSLALLVSGVAAIPAGRWLDRHGPRALMTLGSVAAALLVLVWAGAQHLPLFYLTWAGIGVAMAAVLYEPAFAVVAVRFPERSARNRALTVLTFLAGFASVIFIPLTNWLIDQFGWRYALVALAAILAAGTVIPHALVLRPWPEPRPVARTPSSPVASDRTLREALHGYTFWSITGGFFLAMAAVVAVTIHLIPYLQGRGYSAGFAASAAGLVGLFALPGRLIFTPLGSVLPRQVVTAAIFLLEAIAIVVLIHASSHAAVLLFVALFGAGFGAITPARAALLADIYGAGSFGSINGVLAFFLTAARGVAPVGTSLLVAWWGGYQAALWFLAGLALLAAVIVLFARE